MPELKASAYKTLSFDCYGTLIDWENGILGYLQPLLQSYDVNVIDEWLLQFFSSAEPDAQAQGGSYRTVLNRVLERLGNRLAFTPSDEILAGFAASVEYWQPFPDSASALASLAEQFELIALSNIDDELFALSNRALKEPFSQIITAEQIGAYKPDRRVFQALLDRAEAPLLHVAQSRFHDIVPASGMGIDTVWINRPSLGAAKEVEATPTWTFDSMDAFAAAWR